MKLNRRKLFAVLLVYKQIDIRIIVCTQYQKSVLVLGFENVIWTKLYFCNQGVLNQIYQEI